MPDTHFQPASAGSSMVISPDAFWQHRRQLAGCLAVAMLLGLVYFLVAKPKYQVEARLLVERRGQPLEEERSHEIARDFLPTQAEIIRSPAVIKHAADSLSLPDSSDPEVSPVLSILQRLEVEPLLGTSVLNIQFHDPDATRAIETIKAIIGSYEDYLRSSEQASHRETVALLTQREQEMRDDIRRLQAEYAELRANNPGVGPDRDGAQIQRAMVTSLGETLTTTQRRRIELENHLRLLHSLRESRLAGTTGSIRQTSLTRPASVLPGTQARSYQTSLDVLSRITREGLVSGEDPAPIQEALLAAQSRDAELSKQFGHKHPAVQGVRNLIESLNERLRETVETAPGMLQRELESLHRQEEDLEELYSREFKQAKIVDTFLVKEQQQLDEIARVQTIHDTIVAKLSSFQLADQAVTGGRSSVTVSLLDGPELVDDLVWPQPVPLFGLCALMGLAGGVMMIMATQRRTTTTSGNEPAV